MAYYNKQVIDLKAASGITTDQSNEHQRRWTEKGWADAARRGNYDPTRRDLNFEIGCGGVVQPIDKSKSIPQRIKATLAERGIEDPNVKRLAAGKEPNRRTVVNIIFSGSRERMHELAFGNQYVNLEHGADNSCITRCSDIEGWAKDVYQFCCDKWGEDNIVGFYAHLDETSPHIHCTLLPIVNNKFSFRKLFAGESNTRLEFQERTRQLHDELAVVNEKWGLIRGSDKRETGARHRTSEEYWLALRAACDELEIEINGKQRTLDELYTDIRKAETKVKSLTTMISNLEHKIDDLNAELESLNDDLAAGRGDQSDLLERIANLEREVRLARSKLEEKREKLKQANWQHDDLLRKIESAKVTASNLATQNTAMEKDRNTLLRMRIIDSGYATIVNEVRKMYRMLTPEQRSTLNNDFVETLAEKPIELIKCALMLALGYIDSATSFAESCGGGGTTSDSKWGKDPDEDDRKYAYRCLMNANRMLRPAGVRQSMKR